MFLWSDKSTNKTWWYIMLFGNRGMRLSSNNNAVNYLHFCGCIDLVILQPLACYWRIFSFMDRYTLLLFLQPAIEMYSSVQLFCKIRVFLFVVLLNICDLWFYLRCSLEKPFSNSISLDGKFLHCLDAEILELKLFKANFVIFLVWTKEEWYNITLGTTFIKLTLMELL